MTYDANRIRVTGDTRPWSELSDAERGSAIWNASADIAFYRILNEPDATTRAREDEYVEQFFGEYCVDAGERTAVRAAILE